MNQAYPPLRIKSCERCGHVAPCCVFAHHDGTTEWLCEGLGGCYNWAAARRAYAENPQYWPQRAAG